MIFDIENSLWMSNFCTLQLADKARQSITGCLQSRRMANFVKPFEKWVAEGDASEVSDFTLQISIFNFDVSTRMQRKIIH